MRRILLTAVLLLSLGGLVLGMFFGPLAETSDQLWPASWVAWSVVGWIILIRRPGNTIGMACVAIGLVWGVSFGLQSIVLRVPLEAAAWIELVYTILGVVPWLIVVWLLTTFPTGEYAGPLEKFVGRALIVVGSLAVIGFVLSPVPLTDTGLDNPLGVELSSVLNFITSDTGFFFVVGLTAAAIVSLIRPEPKEHGHRASAVSLAAPGCIPVRAHLRRRAGLARRLRFRIFLAGGRIGHPHLHRCRGSQIPSLRDRPAHLADRRISLVIGVLGLVFVGVVTSSRGCHLPRANWRWPGPLSSSPRSSTHCARGSKVGSTVASTVRSTTPNVSWSNSPGRCRTGSTKSDLVQGWVGVVSETMQPALAGVWVRDRS